MQAGGAAPGGLTSSRESFGVNEYLVNAKALPLG